MNSGIVRRKTLFIRFVVFIHVTMASGDTLLSQAWTPDLGDGTYRNPIIYADYSDPDVVRMGDDFYMTTSSFNCVPGLPILHSKDLVNWELTNHAIPRFSDADFDRPQHGNGVWAPAIRYHDGVFYVYYGDPDRGIFMVKAEDPYGEWDPPVLVKKAYGNIDPCPLWDDDGHVYMIHAFAHSRAGVKSLLQVNELTPDGTRIVDKGTIVFDGHEEHPTIEGPKFYKRGGFYYIFAPAGGVKTGWQTVLRSRHVYGPYEAKTAMVQGRTAINGPHQGGYVELDNGEGWFFHFQDKGAYGRIVHLQPVSWRDGWPVVGVDEDSNGVGEPVARFQMPNVGKTYPIRVPQTSDAFDEPELGLQWQWHANPRPGWFSFSEKPGVLRLYAQEVPADAVNFWDISNLLLQKFPAPTFTVTTQMNFDGNVAVGKSGLIVMGLDYATLALRQTEEDKLLEQTVCLDAEHGGAETVKEGIRLEGNEVYLRVTVGDSAVCQFSYSLNGNVYSAIGEPFQAKPGKWIGAKVGLFAVRPHASPEGSHADFEFFEVE